MFRAPLCPSSGVPDRILLQMVTITRVAGWNLGEPCVEDVTRLSSC